jgi:hypothetical protein
MRTDEGGYIGRIEVTMKVGKIEVIAYAGYRGEQCPRTFFIGNKRIEVVKILDQWVEENVHSARRKRCFKLRGDDWKTYILCYDEKENAWLCMQKSV